MDVWAITGPKCVEICSPITHTVNYLLEYCQVSSVAGSAGLRLLFKAKLMAALVTASMSALKSWS